MSDSSRSIPLDSSPGLRACLETMLQGVPVRSKRLAQSKETTGILRPGYFRSLGMTDFTYDSSPLWTDRLLSEESIQLSYPEILIRYHGEFLLIEKFCRERSKKERREPVGKYDVLWYTRLLRNIPAMGYSYSEYTSKECQLRLNRHMLKVISGDGIVEILYSKMLGLIIGAITTTFTRHFAMYERDRNDRYFFSVFTVNRTYEWSIVGLKLFRDTYLQLQASIEKHTTSPIICLVKAHLIFHIVKAKLQDEARRRKLTMSQLFLLGFIYICKNSHRLHEELRLISILSKTFSGSSRFFRVIQYADAARKYTVKSFISRLNRNEWKRLANIETKRYFKYMDMLGNKATDNSLMNLLQKQHKSKRLNTLKLFVPKFKRLFRKQSVRSKKRNHKFSGTQTTPNQYIQT